MGFALFDETYFLWGEKEEFSGWKVAMVAFVCSWCAAAERGAGASAGLHAAATTLPATQYLNNPLLLLD